MNTRREQFSELLASLEQEAAEFFEYETDKQQLLQQDYQNEDSAKLKLEITWLLALLQQKLSLDAEQMHIRLLQTLLPISLRPKPSCCIMQFSLPQHYSEPCCNIARWQALTCQETNSTILKNIDFRTCYTTQLLPLELYSCQQQAHQTTQDLILNFKCHTEITTASLNCNTIRFYINANSKRAYQIYAGLQQNILHAELLSAQQNLPLQLKIKTVGFKHKEQLFTLPSETNLLLGHNLLEEFFSFPHKFLFIDMHGIKPINQIDQQKFALKITFTTQQNLPELKPDNLRLNCCPCINITAGSTQVIEHNGEKQQYPLQPDSPRTHAIFAIDEISAWLPHQQKTIKYQATELDNDTELPPTYSTAINSQLNKPALQYKISLHNSPTPAIISSKAWLYEPKLSSHQQLNNLKGCCDNNSAIEFYNLSHLSKITAPDLSQDNILWLIKTLSKNHFSLLGKTGILNHLYSIKANHQQQSLRLINNLLSVNSSRCQQLKNGQLIAGIHSHLHFNSTAFESHGERLIIEKILSQIYSSNAPINSFHNITISST